MKAFVHKSGELKMAEIQDPEAGSGEVVVALKVAGLNRRDLSVPGRRGGVDDALVLGSDGAGVVVATGAEVTHVQEGDEVIINPSLGWFDESSAPPSHFDILGMPDDGTFAEKIAVSAEQVEKKPAHLSWEEAGVLTLSALTGYRALFTRGQLKKGDTLFMPGAGSGVATYLIAFAKAAGARVIVTSRSEEKRRKAETMGADVVLDTNSSWPDALEEETVDLVIDSVGGATFNRSLSLLKKGGRMVIFGATTEDTVEINLRDFFYGQYDLMGSTMGSRQELRDMLAFIEEHEIHPVVDNVFDFNDIQKAFDYMKASEQFGKIGVRISE